MRWRRLPTPADPAIVDWRPREGDRVWVRRSNAPHKVLSVHDDGTRVLLFQLDTRDARVDVPASWVRPQFPEIPR